MSSTVFSPGTTVTSTWLNDVNTVAYKNQRSVMEFGALGNGSTHDTVAIQNAINAVSAAGGGVVTFPVGNFLHGLITPKSNVTLLGSGLGSVLTTDMSIVTGSGVFYLTAGSGGLTNFTVKSLTFNGGRIPNPTTRETSLFLFTTTASEKVSNIIFEDNYFYDAQNNFIYMPAGYTSSVNFDNIVVRDNTFLTTIAKRGGSYDGSTAYPVSMDALRVETFDYFGAGASAYGTIIATNIKFIGNHCEGIRTSADIKRGCHTWTVVGNTCRNMNDVAISSDGSFNGTIMGNSIMIDSGYPFYFNTPDNCIEIQGEHINVKGNSIDCAGLLNNAMYIHSYGIPAEGSNRGHQPVCVIVSGNSMKGTTSSTIRVDNGVACQFANNTIENTTGHTVSVSSGTTQTGADGVTPLQSMGSFVGGNSSVNATLGVSISGNAVGMGYAPCRNEYGQDWYDVGTTAPGGTSGGNGNISSAANAPFLNDGYREMSVNPLMIDYNASGVPAFYAATHSAVLTSLGAGSAPTGGAAAWSVQDADGTNIAALSYSPTPTVTQNQRLYLRVSAQYNNSAFWSLQIDELPTGSSTPLASYYYGVSNFNLSGGGWVDYDVGHTVQNATCTRVKLYLNPAAAASTDGTKTGITTFSNLRISHTTIGVF